MEFLMIRLQSVNVLHSLPYLNLVENLVFGEILIGVDVRHHLLLNALDLEIENVLARLVMVHHLMGIPKNVGDLIQKPKLAFVLLPLIVKLGKLKPGQKIPEAENFRVIHQLGGN